MREAKRVLIVEDEPEIRQLVALHLKREGFDVRELADGLDALKLLDREAFELVILDWMVPGRSGLEITRWMRSQPRFLKTAILMVTAKTEPEHVATGLDAGADDYLAKPFDTIVLMARVHALLRRGQWLKSQAEAGSELRLGDLVLFPEGHEAFLHGERLDLTKSEFRLLETLLQNRGRVLSRESLINEIQGDGVNVVGRTVDTHVFGIRKKLGSCADLIETIRGVGYRVGFPNQP